jgi:hypothetical protein
MIYSEHSKQVIESVKKIHHRTIYRQTGLRGTAGIGIKNPESHPGAPCSLSPQLQMPIFIFGFKRRPGTANTLSHLNLIFNFSYSTMAVYMGGGGTGGGCGGYGGVGGQYMIHTFYNGIFSSNFFFRYFR